MCVCARIRGSSLFYKNVQRGQVHGARVQSLVTTGLRLLLLENHLKFAFCMRSRKTKLVRFSKRAEKLQAKNVFMALKCSCFESVCPVRQSLAIQSRFSYDRRSYIQTSYDVEIDEISIPHHMLWSSEK